MSQCLNPTCLHQNPQGTSFCQKCGGKIILDDRYRPIKFLGEGGFGRTFQAIDEKRLNTPCVIKQFLPQQAGSAALQKATELFQQEAKRLQELGKHPQIPDLEAFFPQDGRLYLVQDFIDGQNLLEEFQNQGKLKEPQIRIILTELLPVLQFIHDNQVIHRDIKPENIIRSKTGQLFLIDFGVSKETSGTILTRVGTTVGTPGYAPPEQFRGMVYHSSDLYSLAVTCVRLLTGHFQEADGADKLFDTRKMQWQWQKYVSLSQELTTVLEIMLQDIPVKRYQSATEVLAALANKKTGVIPTATNPPKPPANINVNINPQSSFTEDLGNGVKLEMIAIPGGTFWMGSPANEAKRHDDEGPQHQVTVPSFFMGKYPLTQAQYQAIMGHNPSYFKGNNRPVETVSWDDAVTFCRKLSQRTGKNYRLPSEAEWEYACRAGTKTPFSFGDNITTDLVNYNGNYPYKSAPKGKYRQQTTDVGTFPPNAFGLYDMHGNVWEWCEDDWHENYINAPINGSAWKNQSGSNIKLLRGGSWYYFARYCRSALRLKDSRGLSYRLYGFRLAVSLLATE
ncbi:bifunctional serine/threonine-protein kinase/formylglycine-generating enzyme family protein [Dolichospermum planctonicum]|uniref:Serine/threonine protein kinase n=1 Tax=Dolichospermum planctonicum TaxID=136072 RepID=A0A480AJF2_9CYAN|nr:bifunctional serine/threonine-protein kinase/formylglycine-generating enzyme family protein [Dolichospermum planctonicum]GCL43458.1 serine/threonine protein kinase [Dolichospermum planctonicum]